MLLPTLIIGIGNEYRGDDGIGLAAIRALKARKLQGALLIECNGDGTALLEVWENAGKVVLIDAASSGARAGTIHRIDALTRPLPANISFSSTHTFGVTEAIALARALDKLPSCLIIYAIEGKDFSPGAGLSPEVEEAMHETIEQVIGETAMGRAI